MHLCTYVVFGTNFLFDEDLVSVRDVVVISKGYSTYENHDIIELSEYKFVILKTNHIFVQVFYVDAVTPEDIGEKLT